MRTTRSDRIQDLHDRQSYSSPLQLLNRVLLYSSVTSAVITILIQLRTLTAAGHLLS